MDEQQTTAFKNVDLTESYGDDILAYSGRIVSLSDTTLKQVGVWDTYPGLEEYTLKFNLENKRKDIDILWTALKKLYPCNHRRFLIFYMRFYLSISFRTIAQIFKCSHVMIIKDLRFTINKLKHYIIDNKIKLDSPVTITKKGSV